MWQRVIYPTSITYTAHSSVLMKHFFHSGIPGAHRRGSWRWTCISVWALWSWHRPLWRRGGVRYDSLHLQRFLFCLLRQFFLLWSERLCCVAISTRMALLLLCFCAYIAADPGKIWLWSMSTQGQSLFRTFWVFIVWVWCCNNAIFFRVLH